MIDYSTVVYIKELGGTRDKASCPRHLDGNHIFLLFLSFPPSPFPLDWFPHKRRFYSFGETQQWVVAPNDSTIWSALDWQEQWKQFNPWEEELRRRVGYYPVIPVSRKDYGLWSGD